MYNHGLLQQLRFLLGCSPKQKKKKAEILSSNIERCLPLASKPPGLVVKSPCCSERNPASAKAVISVTSFPNKAVVLV